MDAITKLMKLALCFTLAAVMLLGSGTFAFAEGGTGAAAMLTEGLVGKATE